MAPNGRLARRGERDVVPFVYSGAAIFAPALFVVAPAGAFSLTRLFDRAEAQGRLYGLRLDGVWFRYPAPAEVSIDWNEVIMKGLTIKGIYGRQMFETWYKMAALLQSGLNVRPVITHRLPYTQYQHAFDIMAKGQSGKVVMDWSSQIEPGG